MSNGSINLVFGLSLTILAAFGSYVSTMDACYQAELQRLGQPCPAYLVLLEQPRAAGAPLENGILE